MSFFSGMINGLRELWAHKFRSFLTMIGIILGVASLVTMVAVVDGLFRNMTIFFEQSGGIELVRVLDQEVPLEQLNMAALSPGRTVLDSQAIRGAVPLAAAVAPEVFVGYQKLRFGNKSTSMRVSGTTGDILQTNLLEIERGRNISDLDIDHASQVVVIGSEARNALFLPHDDPLGQAITIGGRPFTVIGLTKHYEFMQADRNALAWKNRGVYIPVSTAQKRFTGNQRVHGLYVRAINADSVGDMVPQVENVLMQIHRGVLDFTVETREDQLAEFRKLERSFMFSMGSIAFVSLMVGGIGIANVMLAVINERIREIGVRKAVGARGIDIFMQFLAEALVVSALGGLFGMVLSFILVDIMRKVVPTGENIAVPVMALVVGFVFSVGIGMLSGIYPAIRAAKLDPIEALRYE